MGPFGYWAYPQQERADLKTEKIDLTRVSQVSADGTYLTSVGSTNTITGRIYKGGPSGGDFVTRAAVGIGYVSPGY